MTSPVQPDHRPRFAARLEDWLHVRRARRAISRGKKPSVIPYIGYGTTEWVRVLGRVLYLRPESREHTRFRPDVAEVSRVRGWRTFTSLSVPHQPVRVLIDGKPVTEVIADRGGVIDAMVPVRLEPGWHTVTLQAGDSEAADAPVNVVTPDARLGVISDIDDTILITALPRPFVAAWNSFVLDEHARSATPGMAVMLDHLVAEHPGSPVMYLSTGAWNAAPALSRFLARNLYPMGPLLLTDWGPTHDRWFRSGREHKSRELRRIAREFPGVKWVLIGDDGQHDETLYHEFAMAHPESVAAVLIRQLSVGEAVLAGGRSKARLHRSTSGVPWVYGPDGATLREELRKLDLL
ncbi:MULTISPECIES: App1 family protein [Leucobacter]|uniref:App1 family protein n=1 Tax=Leucobacter TaxID=55968 RepID=UPI0006A77C76|nr:MULTISPECIES: phosphatase domain-containing protein [Leucobacter]